MLRLIEIPLKFPEEIKFNSSMGSLFHGLLMERLGEDISAQLHTNSVRPYSQCVYYDKARNTPIWRLGIINDRLYEYIIEGISSNKELYLRHKQYVVLAGEISEVQTSSFEQIMDEAFAAATVDKRAELKTITTTAFKNNGEIINFPNPTMMFSGLLNRWNGFSPEIRLEEPYLHQTLGNMTKVIAYDLHTNGYCLEGVSIYGFYGKFKIGYNANEMSRRIINALVKFSPYVGLGIKTALGMGAVELVKRK